MKRIGLLIERHWHYSRRLCEGIAAFSRGRGDLLLEFPEFGAAQRRRVLSQFDGFIARVWSPGIAALLKSAHRPVVDVYGGVTCPDFVLVDQNAERIGELAAGHLAERRFTRFAFCGYAYQRFSVRRREAFVAALERRHFGCDVFEDKSFTASKFGMKILGNGDYDPGIGARPLARWLARLEKPVAIFCAHDLVAMRLVEVCRDSGIGVPRDVAVLGVDDDPLLCDFRNPTISSIDPAPFEIGYRAAETLVRWLENPAEKPPGATPPPRGLVERASTLSFPLPEPWLSDALVFIRRNVSRNINASEVIASVGLSHTTVERAFKKRLGVSVRQEIARVRIAEAKRLLETTSLPLREVCTLSGHSSPAYFTAAFGAATGSTPLAWREAAMRQG